MHRYTYTSATLFALLLSASVASADHSVDPAMESHAGEAMTTIMHATPTVSADCRIEGNLSVGMRGEEVSCLQKALISHGLLSISGPTGYFGEMTKLAVQKWQEEMKLPATGYFGALSRAAFGSHEEAHETAAATAVHAHEPLDVAAWPSVPSVTITLHKDSLSGYNLEIVPVNFRFAPEHVNGATVPNEGHTHVMIDGVKLARVYGSWYHIPKEAFKKAGSHEVLVTLNANDHSDLQYQGARIEARATVTIE